jgi:DNA-binding GntR family transcriptional regulator
MKPAVETQEQANAPLSDRAYRTLRAAIVRCDFAPGERLKLDVLIAQFGLSSSPLREALNRLAQEGLVRSLDHRGFRVAPLSVEMLHDLTRMRLLVETEALRLAMEHGGDEWETAVVAAFHRLSLLAERRDAGKPVDMGEWTERHREFHMALFSGCGSPLLMQSAETYFTQAERYRRFAAAQAREPRCKMPAHQGLMHAALARKQAEAVELLRKHIQGTTDTVDAALKKMAAPVTLRAPRRAA